MKMRSILPSIFVATILIGCGSSSSDSGGEEAETLLSQELKDGPWLSKCIANSIGSGSRKTQYLFSAGEMEEGLISFSDSRSCTGESRIISTTNVAYELGELIDTAAGVQAQEINFLHTFSGEDRTQHSIFTISNNGALYFPETINVNWSNTEDERPNDFDFSSSNRFTR